jgi:pyridoxine 4-dehydrogenase
LDIEVLQYLADVN